MAETTGLLNRRTGNSVPRVRISSSPLRNRCNLLKISKLQRFFYFLSPKNSPKNLPFTTDFSKNFGVVGYVFIQFFAVELPALSNLVLNSIFLQYAALDDGKRHRPSTSEVVGQALSAA